MARALHVIVFNRQDPEECQRVIACYRALMKAYADALLAFGALFTLIAWWRMDLD